MRVSSRLCAVALVLAFGSAVRTAVCEPSAGLLVKDGDRIAFMGDSITLLGDWPIGYVNLVMDGLKRAGLKDAVKIAAGAGGDRSNRMLARIDKVLAQKPDWILISCGVNDVWHREHVKPDGRHTGVDLPDYIRNMREMYDRCDKAGAKVVVLTSTMITEDENDQKNKWLVDYNEFERAEAKKRGYVLADLNAAMWRRLRKIRETDKTPGLKLTRDGVHVNFTGDCQMAATILEAFGASARLGGSEEAIFEGLKSSSKEMKGGEPMFAGFSMSEYERFRAAAKASGKSDSDYALDLYLEGIELAAALGSLPPKAPDAPSRPVPEHAAPEVRVKDGARIAFVGDYYFEIGKNQGRCVDQVMRGLAAAGVKKVVKVPGWMRWEKSAQMLERMDKFLKKNQGRKSLDLVVFFVGNDDLATNAGPVVPFEETRKNLLAAFDRFAALKLPVVVCTLRPCRGSETTDAFLREEAAKRGWMLADVAATARAAKSTLDFQDYFGHSLVAKTILKAMGVDEDTVDFVTKTNLDMPGVRAVTVPTTIYQARRARDVFAQFGVREIPARDILLALTDPEKRAVWESKRAK